MNYLYCTSPKAPAQTLPCLHHPSGLPVWQLDLLTHLLTAQTVPRDRKNLRPYFLSDYIYVPDLSRGRERGSGFVVIPLTLSTV